MELKEKERQALQIIGLAASVSKNCVLFFSGGKDSVAVLHLLEKAYNKKDINLVFMPFVDGLDETELVAKIAKSLDYEINLYQHWRFFVDKAQGSYCPPSGKPKRIFDIYAEARADFGRDIPIFYGAKKSDGIWRRLVTGKGKENRGIYAPIYEWSKYDVLSYIRKNRLDYLKQEGDRISGVDLSDKYLVWAYENKRRSYEAIKKEFPFVDVVIKRHEFFNESWKEKTGEGG
ncbi:MAG: phosphoadenosine phosphosulfate reductase family protein [Spirochaetaceae bacterium]|jgi:3'-phosphoadenosine 5'-phosphosulfate sulfotransferase (PAPS reductase)/FAD synthetase|nr:phosphoadenosine phosphosulfate reductase family protein [Spirochaetaceae bacterium]